MPKAPPSIDWYYNDWVGGTSHLSNVEYACYHKLLMFQWQNGHIPADPAVRAVLCDVEPEAWEAVWKHIQDKFASKESAEIAVLVNPRMDADRDEAIASWKPRKVLSDARRKAGRKGGIQSGRTRMRSKTTENKGQNHRSKNEAKTKQNEAKLEGGRGNKEEGRKIRKRTVNVSHFGSQLQAAVVDWLAYKDERSESYTERGLKAFLSQVKKMEAKFGSDHVAELMELAMSNEWKGWNYKRGESGPKKTFEQQKLDNTKEALREFADE